MAATSPQPSEHTRLHMLSHTYKHTEGETETEKGRDRQTKQT